MCKTGRYCWIFYDGVWIHKYSDGVIAATNIKFNMSVSGVFKRTRYNCLYNYKLEKGDVIIDVGAGIGEETLVFSKGVGQSGKVVSISSVPSNSR